MTDTTAVDETSEDALPQLEESEHLGADAPAQDTPLKTRLLLPILVPLLSIAIVALLVLNISRIFLADDKNAALGMAIFITLAILVGGSILAAFPRLKTSSLAVILGSVFLLVSLAGLVTLGASLNDGEGATTSVYATGPAKSTVDVTAGPGLTFDGKQPPEELQLQASAGIVQINYGGASGHTLAIQNPKFQGFLLESSAGGRKSGKIDLPAGSYTFYCTVPGHEAAGMKGTLTVK
jgi:uncharacterized cupredoxin-like copper-binding protein